MMSDPFTRDDVQFPRLLAELRAKGLTKAQYKFLQESADLTQGDVDDIMARAEETFEAIKEQVDCLPSTCVICGSNLQKETS
jgi:hypothetical protein